ncbi:MAG: hypothetical protein J7647_10375 [Cyanobacteria bacterium SBLK]|nr:hypothetical protein [Cyanobacteria bacterium SBLK]
MSIENIGRIKGENLANLHSWCEEHRKLLSPTLSRYARGRQELWLRRYCDLRRDPTIVQGYRNERIEALGERLLPGFHIGLFLLYPPKTCILPHRDHGCLAPTAVSVNLSDVVFVLNEERHELKNGDVTRFNSKSLHATEPKETERFALIFWHLKEKYVKPIKGE